MLALYAKAKAAGGRPEGPGEKLRFELKEGIGSDFGQDFSLNLMLGDHRPFRLV